MKPENQEAVKGANSRIHEKAAVENVVLHKRFANAPTMLVFLRVPTANCLERVTGELDEPAGEFGLKFLRLVIDEVMAFMPPLLTTRQLRGRDSANPCLIRINKKPRSREVFFGVNAMSDWSRWTNGWTGGAQVNFERLSLFMILQ